MSQNAHCGEAGSALQRGVASLTRQMEELRARLVDLVEAVGEPRHPLLRAELRAILARHDGRVYVATAEAPNPDNAPRQRPTDTRTIAALPRKTLAELPNKDIGTDSKKRYNHGLILGMAFLDVSSFWADCVECLR